MPTATPQPQSLTGAGASFPYPLINAWIGQYTTSVKPEMQINYQSIGSGGGIKAMQDKTVNFGASDAPLSTTDQGNVPNALHIPETIGAVTIAYNLPGVPSTTNLNLTGPIIANIYLGVIQNWNDPAIQNLNPTVTLPNQPIKTVHRSDSSGTTFVFTGYLTLVSQTWSTQVGQGKSVSWPTAPSAVIGNNNNAGVASTVNGTQYSIGYVELAYALQNGMTVAAVQNPAGNWIVPSLASTTAAAQAATNLPAGNESWVGINLLNTPDANAYPIVSFSYLLVYKELNVLPDMTQAKATALVQFIWWAVHDGQNTASAQSYAPLPANVVTLDETTIRSITFDGQTLSVT